MVEELITTHDSLDKAVFDSAYRKAGSYWQWSSVTLDGGWDGAAECVHKAWPTKMGSFTDQSAIYFGVLDESAVNRWFYRVYPGGRDSFGRPGRYFLVIFRIQSPEQVLLPEVSGLLKYFDTERGLPLNTAPLDGGIPGREPGELLLKLHRHWISGNNDCHWGMDGSGTIIRFGLPSRKATQQPETPILITTRLQLQPKWLIFSIGLVIGLAIGIFLGAVLHNQWSNSMVPAAPPPIPSVPSGSEKNNERTNPKRPQPVDNTNLN